MNFNKEINQILNTFPYTFYTLTYLNYIPQIK